MKNALAIVLATVLPASSFAGVETMPLATEQITPAKTAQMLPPSTLPAAFREGEDLRFAVKWGMITGGYSSLSINNSEAIDGRPTYHVVAEAHSTGLVNTMYPVNDRNEAWLEPHSPSTLRYARNIHEGKFAIEEQVTLDQVNHRFHQHSYRADKKRHKEHDGEIPPNVLDVLGSLYYIRTLPLEVGKSYTIDVHSSNTVYPLVVNVKRRQTVKVKAGKFDCFVVEPVLREPGIFVTKGKKLEVFLTADERRMPVMMRSEIFIGHVAAELVSHRSTTPLETVALSQAQKATPENTEPVVNQ